VPHFSRSLREVGLWAGWPYIPYLYAEGTSSKEFGDGQIVAQRNYDYLEPW